MKNAPLKSARRRGLWKCGQGIRLAHSPSAEQNQKKRTNHVLPKPDNFIRYRQGDPLGRPVGAGPRPHPEEPAPLRLMPGA
jgi:hypothetical protein